MKNKNHFVISKDAPFSFVFVVLSVILFLIDNFILKGKLHELILCSPTKSGGEVPFLASSALSYFRIFFYIFGGSDFKILFFNLIFILLMGQILEEYYGSIVIGICFFVSTIFSGVLNSIFSLNSLNGCTCIVMMMIFQNIFMNFSKGKISIPSFVIAILFIIFEISSKNQSGILGFFINFIGGLCGSLLVFILSPLFHPVQKKEKDNSSKNIRTKNDKSEETDDDSTVVGTLKF